MDPNATLQLISECLRHAENPDWHCQDLYDWISRGGFEPDWSKHASAAEYYRCRAVHHRRGERCQDEE